MKEINNTNEQIKNKKVWKGILFNLRHSPSFIVAILFVIIAILETVIPNIIQAFTRSNSTAQNVFTYQAISFFILALCIVDIKTYELNFFPLPIKAQDILRAMIIFLLTVLILSLVLIVPSFVLLYYYQNLKNLDGLIIFLFALAPIIFTLCLFIFSISLARTRKNEITKYVAIYSAFIVNIIIFSIKNSKHELTEDLQKLILFCKAYPLQIIITVYLASIVISFISYRIGLKKFSSGAYRQVQRRY